MNENIHPLFSDSINVVNESKLWDISTYEDNRGFKLQLISSDLIHGYEEDKPELYEFVQLFEVGVVVLKIAIGVATIAQANLDDSLCTILMRIKDGSLHIIKYIYDMYDGWKVLNAYSLTMIGRAISPSPYNIPRIIARSDSSIGYMMNGDGTTVIYDDNGFKLCGDCGEFRYINNKPGRVSVGAIPVAYQSYLLLTQINELDAYRVAYLNSMMVVGVSEELKRDFVYPIDRNIAITHTVKYMYVILHKNKWVVSLTGSLTPQVSNKYIEV